MCVYLSKCFQTWCNHIITTPLRQTINILTLALTGILLIPAGLILASWKAIPGDSLYSTKRTLEKAALILLSPNYHAHTSLQTNLITRRLEEADVSIDKHTSSAGLQELKRQLQQAHAQVEAAPNPQTKQQATRKLVQTLNTTNRKLELKKQTLITHQTIYETQYITQQVTQVIQNNPPPAPASPTTTDTSQTIVEDIDAVQDEIEDIIDTIDTPTPPSPPASGSSNPTDTGGSNGNNNGNNNSNNSNSGNSDNQDNGNGNNSDETKEDD